MGKLDVKDFDALRVKVKEDKVAEKENKIILKVGLGTCGLAAGAQAAIDALKTEIAKEQLDNVEIQRTSCLGLCYCEPNIEVFVPGMPNVIYGNVTPEVARKIVVKHVVNKKLVSGYIFDQLSPDIMNV